MSRLSTLRLVLAAALIAAFTGISVIASQKTAATMLKAATTFADSLTPEQKAKAMFPFEARNASAGISSPTKCSRARA